jgi:transcriptional regulator with XRE-family HTH domain
VAKKQVYSVNQLVAYNLQRARQLRGMTQADFGAEIERVTGRPWSNATVSAAERSWDGNRVRQFDANELVAMCVILEVPLGWFFLMPREGADFEFTACDDSAAKIVKILPEWVLEAIWPSSAPGEYGYWLQQDLQEHAGRTLQTAPLPLTQWAQQLREIADQLDDAQGGRK